MRSNSCGRHDDDARRRQRLGGDTDRLSLARALDRQAQQDDRQQAGHDDQQGAQRRLAEQLVDAGYRRLKIKIDPGGVDTVAHELSHRVGSDVELQVDGNGSLGAEHLMALLGLTWHGVTTIEQPFPVDRPDLAAELMLGTDGIVMADEAATSIGAVRALREQSAMRAVAVKPSRLGGIVAAVEMVAWCSSNDVGAAVGGMLESSLGRHALAAVAAIDGFTVTGDLSPASQWLAADPWPDLDMVDGAIVVPTSPGVAPLPDLGTLDAVTRRRVEHRR